MWGPPLGAVVIYLLQHFLWGNLFGVHLLALGILMVILVLFLPEGILGALAGDNSTYTGRLLSRFIHRKQN